MKKYLILLICILAGSAFLLVKQNKKLKRENERQSGNVETLMSDINRYKVTVRYSDSVSEVNAASVSALNLTNSELKKYRADDAQLIKSLGIKVSRLEALIKTSTETKDTIPKEAWKPSEKLPDCLEYSDRWSTITACFKDSSVIYAVRDSLALAVHKVPKKRFLWWRWGTKGYKVEIVNFNPKSEIRWSEIIKIK